MCSTFTYGNKYTHLYICVYLYAHTHTYIHTQGIEYRTWAPRSACRPVLARESDVAARVELRGVQHPHTLTSEHKTSSREGQPPRAPPLADLNGSEGFGSPCCMDARLPGCAISS